MNISLIFDAFGGVRVFVTLFQVDILKKELLIEQRPIEVLDMKFWASLVPCKKANFDCFH